MVRTDPAQAAASLKQVLLDQLAVLDQLSPEALVAQRYQKIRQFGAF